MGNLNYLKHGTAASLFITSLGITSAPALPEGDWERISSEVIYSSRVNLPSYIAEEDIIDEIGLNPYTSIQKIKISIKNGGAKEIYPLEDYNRIVGV